MERYSFTSTDTGGIVQVKSDRQIELIPGFHRFIDEQDDCIITHSCVVKSKIKEDEKGGFFYVWYEMEDYSKEIDRAAKIREVTALSFRSAASSGGIKDSDIANHADMLETWDYPINYVVGDLRRHEGLAYRCRQSHTSQENYPPRITPSLWANIPKEGQGSHDNPIPYDASIGMELEEGKFYTEDNVLYECFRSTGVPVYNRLADLVNLYVRVSN